MDTIAGYKVQEAVQLHNRTHVCDMLKHVRKQLKSQTVDAWLLAGDGNLSPKVPRLLQIMTLLSHRGWLGFSVQHLESRRSHCLQHFKSHWSQPPPPTPLRCPPCPPPAAMVKPTKVQPTDEEERQRCIIPTPIFIEPVDKREC